MDGTELEEQQKDGNMVVSYMPSLNEVTHILQSGISEAATTSQVSNINKFIIINIILMGNTNLHLFF